VGVDGVIVIMFITDEFKGEKRSLFVFLLIAASIIIAYNFYSKVEKRFFDIALYRHAEIINHTAAEPYNHRVLMPYIFDVSTKVLSKFCSHDFAFKLTFLTYDFICIFLLLYLIYRLLNKFFTDFYLKLFGTLWTALSLVLALRTISYGSWMLLETVVFVAGVLFMFKKQYVPLFLCTLVSAFNRETAVFLILAYYFQLSFDHNISPSVKALRIGGLIAAYLVSVIVLKSFNIPGIFEFAVMQFKENIASPVLIVKNLATITLLFNVFIFLAYKGYRYSEYFVKRLFLVIPFIVIGYVFFSPWNEIVTLIPLYAVLLPAGLFYAKRIISDMAY